MLTRRTTIRLGLAIAQWGFLGLQVLFLEGPRGVQATFAVAGLACWLINKRLALPQETDR